MEAIKISFFGVANYSTLNLMERLILEATNYSEGVSKEFSLKYNTATFNELKAGLKLSYDNENIIKEKLTKDEFDNVIDTDEISSIVINSKHVIINACDGSDNNNDYELLLSHSRIKNFFNKLA